MSFDSTMEAKPGGWTSFRTESFTHLHVHSNFSFLDGGSDVRALVDRAKAVGCDALALTDHNGLYGAVRFYKYAREAGIKPIIGVEMDVERGEVMGHGSWVMGPGSHGCSMPHAPCPMTSRPAGEPATGHIVLLAKDLTGYSNLCKIVTRAQLAHEKGKARANLEILNRYREQLFGISGCPKGEIPSLLAAGKLRAARKAAERYIDIFGRENFLIELQNHLLPGANLLNSRLVALADELSLRIVATNNVHYAEKEEFKVQDVLACVRTLTTLDDEHELRKRNWEYYLKSPRAMAKLFARYPKAVAATTWVARQCGLDLGLGSYRFPDFPVPEGETAYSYLYKLCFEGFAHLYRPITPRATERLQHELAIIHDLGFAEYFLVVWDIVRHARSKGIRCSGRGSAADSIVAYCLGITIVDPLEHDLLFERFLNPQRRGMPDIDVDFDANRRDEVIEYIYNRYGEDKVAMVCTVSTLCAKSAVRDIGKAMDFPPAEVGRLASALPHTSARRIREAAEKLPEIRDSNIPLWKLETLVDMCEKVDGFPRHLSVHLGGLVISRGLLTDLVPLEWATKGVIVSQFDKDDIEELGLVKMDILGLRNLAAIEDALALIRENHGIELDIDNLPLDDEPVYELLRSTKTVGLFQVESPGMRGLLGRLQPERFQDIIAQISLFRPGPMQADMINPFIARRHGEEPVVYPHPCLEPVLKDTYGVILYQEQVLQVSSALAGFTPGQADSLRRAMTTDRSQAEMEKIKLEFLECAKKNGIADEVAEDVFSRLRAFAAYGFCKAHAASFAKITYQTAYLKAHYPAEFLAGILSNEPMGFYPANVVVEEARRLGIEILGVDVNRSGKKFTVEEDWGRRPQVASVGGPETPRHQVEKVMGHGSWGMGKVRRAGPMTHEPRPGIRIALSQVKGMSEAAIDSIIRAREGEAPSEPFSSFADFCTRTKVDRPIVENLINCGAFDSFDHSRGKLLWLLGEIGGRGPGVRGRQSTISNSHDPCPMSLLHTDESDEQLAYLPDVPERTPHERLRMDYEILGLSPMCHPMMFYREKLDRAGVVRSSEIERLPNNAIIRVAGVVVVCMRPPTKSGTIVVFVTLEDEDGLVDAVIFPKVYDKYGRIIFNNPALIIEGRLQRMGRRSISIIATKVCELGSEYRSESPAEHRPFKERARSAGQRSWVKSHGV
jgi:error-prone DNA polymerase